MRRQVGRAKWHCNWLKLRLSGETGEEGGGEGWVLSSSIEVFGNTWKYNLRSTSIKQSRKFHGAVNLRFCSMKTVRIYLPWMLYSTKCRLARTSKSTQWKVRASRERVSSKKAGSGISWAARMASWLQSSSPCRTLKASLYLGRKCQARKDEKWRRCALDTSLKSTINYCRSSQYIYQSATFNVVICSNNINEDVGEQLNRFFSIQQGGTMGDRIQD